MINYKSKLLELLDLIIFSYVFLKMLLDNLAVSCCMSDDVKFAEVALNVGKSGVYSNF